MYKGISNDAIYQEKMRCSLFATGWDMNICVDFNTPGMSSNGGLLQDGNMRDILVRKIGQLIPDGHKNAFVHHSYIEMVNQPTCQILWDYEDADEVTKPVVIHLPLIGRMLNFQIL